jgi:ABC-type multidrug transport system fused ATPase/permease subunit
VAITYSITQAGSFSSAAPKLGIYFLAGARLVPALAGVLQAWSELRFAGPAVDALQATLDDVASPQKTSGEDGPPPPALLLTNKISFGGVSFGYPNGHTIQCCASLSIQAGDIVGVTGKSGSGKSAFFLSLMGMLPLKGGTILIDRTGLSIKNRRSWLANISYISQSPFFLDESVADNIAFGVPSEAQDRARIVEAAKAAGAHDFIIRDLKSGYDESVGESGLRLSGGQRQRVAIARALYANRQVLLLDEMTSALDAASEKTVLNTLEQLRGKHTIIIVTHRPEPLEICNVVLCIDGGVLREVPR